MERITADTIIDFLKEKVEQHEPLPPSIWLDSCQKLNILLGDEHDKLHDLESQVAKEKLKLMDSQEEINVSEAKSRIEATETYLEMRKQKSKCDRIVEFIRISKLQARLRDTEMKGY